MGAIIWLLIIVFAIVNMNSKQKKARGAAQKGVPGAGSAAPAGKAVPARRKAAAPETEDDYRAGVPRSEDEEYMSHEGESVASVNDVPVKPIAQPVVRAIDRNLGRQGASMLDDAECAGGSMAHVHTEGRSHLADADCFGGSMEHTHTEGVSRAAHASRMAAIDVGSSAGSDVLPRTIDARALRRAVVMSEVLGRPKGMKIGIRQ